MSESEGCITIFFVLVIIGFLCLVNQLLLIPVAILVIVVTDMKEYARFAWLPIFALGLVLAAVEFYYLDKMYLARRQRKDDKSTRSSNRH
jgi:hypothetical protein